MDKKEQDIDTYQAPETLYCKTKEEFDEAIGRDFIEQANKCTGEGQKFLVGLSHGISPSGAYEYILKNYASIHKPEFLRYTFVNSKLKRQRGLEGVMDAVGFLKELLIILEGPIDDLPRQQNSQLFFVGAFFSVTLGHHRNVVWLYFKARLAPAPLQKIHTISLKILRVPSRASQLPNFRENCRSDSTIGRNVMARV